MKIFLSTGSPNPRDNKQRILDMRKAPRRLVSYANTPEHAKAERAREKAQGTKTVVAVDGLKGKRQKKTARKSRPKGLGLA